VMEDCTMKVKTLGDTLVIKIKMLDEMRLSGSGISWLVATSGGPKRTEVEVDGKPMYVIVNAFVKAERMTQTRTRKITEQLIES
jgi:hypothetical protein